jgi:SAM-dependent methyltransferase
MTYPDYETYAALYAKYVGRDMSGLLDILEPIKDMRILDLCAGDGRLTATAIDRGARESTVVDSEKAMRSPLLKNYQNVHPYCDKVEYFLEATGLTFDRVVCRQAVNYWLNAETATQVARILETGGIFAFNTFNVKPSKKPRVEMYEIAGHSFVETSWLADEDVHHVQVRDGLAPHVTTFKWLPREFLDAILGKHFYVNEKIKGKTSLYTCVKK